MDKLLYYSKPSKFANKTDQWFIFAALYVHAYLKFSVFAKIGVGAIGRCTTLPLYILWYSTVDLSSNFNLSADVPLFIH